jgi:hypothetical protein
MGLISKGDFMNIQELQRKAQRRCSKAWPDEQEGYIVQKDQGVWCAIPSDFKNLQESRAGFGDTPLEALRSLLGFPDELKEDTSFSQVGIDLDDADFLILAKMAHEQDCTFNELCNGILRDAMEEHE